MTTVQHLELENDYILVKQKPVISERTESGLFFSVKKEYKDILIGEVLAVSNNSERDIEIKKGDLVYYTEDKINKTKIDGIDYVFVKEQDVYGYIEN